MCPRPPTPTGSTFSIGRPADERKGAKVHSNREPWVWQTRELRASDAWRSAGINARRFIDFLLLEHMNHGGKENGLLKAPHRQLEDFGIGARRITDTIREAEGLGLVECHRGGLRVAT